MDFLTGDISLPALAMPLPFVLCFENADLEVQPLWLLLCGS